MIFVEHNEKFYALALYISFTINGICYGLLDKKIFLKILLREEFAKF